MLDIERDLREDTTGEYRRSVIVKLKEASTEVRHELSQGLVPEEYQKLSKLLLALDTSVRIVEQY